jgi:hypothetical protein
MTPAAFRQSLSKPVPPKLSAPLTALWWAKKGEWNRAHQIVQDEETAEAAWVHAYLHRVEGDLGNAGYWYRQARRKPATGSLEAEWEAICTELLRAAADS